MFSAYMMIVLWCEGQFTQSKSVVCLQKCKALITEEESNDDSVDIAHEVLLGKVGKINYRT